MFFKKNFYYYMFELASISKTRRKTLILNDDLNVSNF